MEEKLKYNNQNEYLKYILRFPRKPFPIVGRLYAFNYLFHLAPDFRDKDINDKKFYDFFPYDLIIRTNTRKKYFTGVNFHNMSPQARKLLFTKFENAYSSRFEKEFVNLTPMNYRILLKFLKKIGIAVRNYRYERVRHLREVPVESIHDMNNFYANFFYRTNPKWVFEKYRKYVPKLGGK